MPDLDQTLRILSALLPDLRRDYRVRSLAIFGSLARGEARENSDIDILVEFEPDARPTLFSLAGLQIQIEEALHAKVDLVLRRALRPAIRDRADREAIRVA